MTTKREIRQRHESLGESVVEDERGRLIVNTADGARIVYDADGKGGHETISGPTGCYYNEDGDS